MQPDNPKNPIPNKVVHTYTEDMAQALEGGGGGIVKKVIHRQTKHEEQERNLSPESGINRFFMLMSLVLISSALITLFFFIFDKGGNTLPVGGQFVPLVFNDQSTFLEVKGFDKEKIIQMVLNEANDRENINVDGVKGIYLSYEKKIVGLRQFINITKSNLVLEDVGSSTNFVSDNFLLGVVEGESELAPSGQGEGFFILLKMRSMADIFEPLRAWEGKMFSDLHGFFGVELSPDTKYLLTKDFEDGIVANKNARVLYGQDGEIVIMYVFADDASIIITKNPESVKEIILRLASSQTKK
jgi:hypothetical protein